MLVCKYVYLLEEAVINKDMIIMNSNASITTIYITTTITNTNNTITIITTKLLI